MKRTLIVPEGTDWFTEYRERSTYVPARRGWGKAIVAAFLAATLLFAYASATQAKTEHCPDGGVKVESQVDGDLDGIIPAAGTLVCVKGSTDATGIVEADGEMTLVDILGNGHNVSYYVTYSTPEVTPSAPPESDSPTDEPSDTPTDEPTDEPSASTPGSSLPSPSEPTGERPTPPDTATAASGSPANSNLAPLLMLLAALTAGAMLVLPKRR